MNLFGRRPSKAPASSSSHVGASRMSTTATVKQGHQLIVRLEQMRETIGTMEKRKSFLETKARSQLEEAKMKQSLGDKNAAVSALRRKKMYEKEVTNLIQMQGNLESQILAIETSRLTHDVQMGLRVGLDTQTRMNRGLDPDAIAELHDSISDHLQRTEEVSGVMSKSFDAGETYSEDDLLKELEELQLEVSKEVEMEEDFEEVERVAPVVKRSPSPVLSLNLPSVPTTHPRISSHPSSQANEDEEDEETAMKRLEAEMS